LAQITKAIATGHRLEASLIPPNVLKSIDQSELFDRLAYARELTAKARTSRDPVLGRGYGKLARAVLQARPRAEVARQSADLIAKASARPLGAQAAALRRQAEQLLEEHPAAPRREESAPVMKALAEDDDLIPVFNAAGQLLGVCARSAFKPTSAPAVPVGKARRPAPVAGRSLRRA
jgi:hypothetical protein